jgi:Zn-dependent M28 family amino/carboxypeptidase
MVGYRELEFGRDTTSTPWLLDEIWGAAHALGHGKQFTSREEAVGGDDHTPFLAAGVPAADLIQLDTYPHWHTAEDTLDKISRESLQIVGETVLAALPRIEARLRTNGK